MLAGMSQRSLCPCGSGDAFGACCGPLHAGRGSGRVTAPTAERLMRSRYSAFAIRDDAYLLSTWHPSTRPRTVALGPEVVWRKLEVVEVVDGGEHDRTGTVAFRAHFWDAARRERGVLEERSRFVREEGQWCYLAADG